MKVTNRDTAMHGFLSLVLLAVAFLGGCAAGDDNDESPAVSRSGSDPTSLFVDHAGAFDVCKKFVKQRLKAPATAQFSDYFDGDGEVSVSRSEADYTVTSHVDAQNGFGALLQTAFTCEVTRVDEDTFRLVNLDLDE